MGQENYEKRKTSQNVLVIFYYERKLAYFDLISFMFCRALILPSNCEFSIQ